MNKFLKLFVITLLFCGCNNKNTSELVIETSNGNVVYQVETASSQEDLSHGLMDRNSLPKNGGMIFDLSPFMAQPTIMWMKNTKISLDMLFVTKEGFIYWIKENAVPYSEDDIKAPFPAYAVIEINAGDVAKHKIQIGDKVKHAILDKASKDSSATTKPELSVSEEHIEVIEQPVLEIENSESTNEASESLPGENLASEASQTEAQ